jgi:hypothetical protein
MESIIYKKKSLHYSGKLKWTRRQQKMDKIAMKYLAEKFRRTEIKEAAIKAARDKEGLHIQVGGRGIELIEIIAQLVGSVSERSHLPFEKMTEILKAEYESSKEKDFEKVGHDREDINKLFNEVFKDLNL